MKLVTNFLAFQAGWFACVLGAAHGIPWLGPLAVFAAVALHLAMARRPLGELKLIAAAMLSGAVFDSLLLASGWLAYPNGGWVPGLAPYWIIAMWALFATTLNVSLRWLRHSLPLALLVGAVGGPLSYAAGARLGGLEFREPLLALTALAVVWGLVLPVLVLLSSRFDGVAAPAVPEYIHADWRVSHRV